MKKLFLFILIALPVHAQRIENGSTNYLKTLEITFDREYWENPLNQPRITAFLTGIWPNWTNVWPQYSYGGKPWVMHAAPMIRGRVATNGETPTHYLWSVTLGQIRRTNNMVKSFADLHDALLPIDKPRVGVMVSATTVRTRTTSTTSGVRPPRGPGG
jgi:hypothetical protein